eukprot:gb/GECH01004745.1/.p1 GENE.gb/GECH01004745.1/~~gb/GECH01004745.1/.p1  ORF type:complete len:766 (+),score=199.34 gb/GECH01004745.1/:1-2298(+)
MNENINGNISETTSDEYFKYTPISPHKLVRTVPVSVRMIPKELDEELDNEDKSVIPPFSQPLPVPPNCSVFHSKQAQKLNTPIPDAPDVLVREPKHDHSLLNQSPVIPTNAVNLAKKSQGYVHEDVLNVEHARQLVSQALMKPNASSTTNTPPHPNEEDEDNPHDQYHHQDERQQWLSEAIQKHPEIGEMRERLYPLQRAISFGRLYDAGRREVKDVLSDDVVLQLIMQHLQYEGLRNAKSKLEEESETEYRTIDVDGSLIHGIIKEAVKKTERLWDNVIADKLTPNEKQRKPVVMKEIDEALADLGFEENNEDDMSQDINIWNEPPDAPNKNIIIEFDPIKKYEHLHAATLNKLILRLTDPFKSNNSTNNNSNNSKNAYLDSFLLTYLSFTTSDIFLLKLQQRFHVPQRHPHVESTEFEEKKQAIQQAVLQVLKAWLDMRGVEVRILSKMADFASSMITQGNIQEDVKKECEDILVMVEQKKQYQDGGFIDNIEQSQPSGKRPDPKVPGKIFSATLSIMDCDEEEIARQLSLIEFDLFRAILPQELLNQSWNKPKLKHRSPSVIRMLERYDDIAQWTTSLLLRAEKQQERKRCINKLAKIADRLRHQHNYHTLHALLEGLRSPLLKRLTNTNAEMGSNKTLNDLRNLMNNRSNLQVYKEELRAAQKSKKPSIPCLRINLQELGFIEEGHDDYIKVKLTNTHLINWGKRELVAEEISNIQKHQRIPYNYIKVHQIRVLLTELPEKLSESELEDLAAKREQEDKST